MEFAQWIPPPHALPSSAQYFSPPGQKFATQVQPSDPEINYAYADNFIFWQLIRNLEYSLLQIQNHASPHLSKAA